MPASDPVARGVEMGYRVIEEYMRQGQNMARLMWSPYQGGTSSPQDEMQQRMGMMFRSFSDFASLWLELTGMAGKEGFSSREPHREPGMGTAGPFVMGGTPDPAPPDAQVAAPLALTLVIESPLRTEVSVDLRPRSSGLPLKVHDLRAPEPDKPRLTGVTIESIPSEERVAIHLRIPDDQPPGVYSGIILDERTSLPRGTLCVRLSPR